MTNQQQFEIWLAAHAIKKPNMAFVVCVIEFIKKMGLDHTDEHVLNGIPLIPARLSRAWKGDVRRFVCGHIVGGSEALYAEGQTPIKLAMWLHGKSCTDYSVDLSRLPSKDPEVLETRRVAAEANIRKRADSLHRDLMARRNWTACK